MTNHFATLLAVALAATPIGAIGQQASAELRDELGTIASARWDAAPAGDALARVSQGLAPLWVDRRVDRRARLSFLQRQASVALLLDGVAKELSLAAVPIDSVVYLGPPESAAALRALAVEWRRRAPSGLRRRTPLAWPRLTEPRPLFEKIAASAGCTVENPGAIPHDLWPAGQTPPLALGDQLTLIGLGFDLRWRVTAGDKLRLEPLDPTAFTAPPSLDSLFKRTDRGPAQERYTLRVSEARLASLARQLADQLGLELELAPQLAGPEKRVTFAVEGVTREGLLAELAKASGAVVRVEGEALVVGEPE